MVMSIKVTELNHEETHALDKTIYLRENWYLMAWGMGDATAATLFLESRSPVPYKIMCQKRVYNVIRFNLDNLCTSTIKSDEICLL